MYKYNIAGVLISGVVRKFGMGRLIDLLQRYFSLHLMRESISTETSFPCEAFLPSFEGTSGMMSSGTFIFLHGVETVLCIIISSLANIIILIPLKGGMKNFFQGNNERLLCVYVFFFFFFFFRLKNYISTVEFCSVLKIQRPWF